MSDVSMKRLREMLEDSGDRICADKYEEQDMAAELIRLRQLIVSGSEEDKRNERIRCRRLLEVEE